MMGLFLFHRQRFVHRFHRTIDSFRVIYYIMRSNLNKSSILLIPTHINILSAIRPKSGWVASIYIQMNKIAVYIFNIKITAFTLYTFVYTHGTYTKRNFFHFYFLSVCMFRLIAETVAE